MLKHYDSETIKRDIIRSKKVNFSSAIGLNFYYSGEYDNKPLSVVAVASDVNDIDFALEETVGGLMDCYECEIYLDGKELIL